MYCFLKNYPNIAVVSEKIDAITESKNEAAIVLSKLIAFDMHDNGDADLILRDADVYLQAAILEMPYPADDVIGAFQLMIDLGMLEQVGPNAFSMPYIVPVDVAFKWFDEQDARK